MGESVFTLIGSRVAIDAVAENCSLPDMSGYQAVVFTPYSSYMKLGRRLRADDIADFELATASTPELEVAMANTQGERRLFFTRLCGSSWYFGLSGCNVTGFTPDEAGDDDAEEQDWRRVYESEGVNLYLDFEAVRDGWPALVTLPLRASGERRHWTWAGEDGYRMMPTDQRADP